MLVGSTAAHVAVLFFLESFVLFSHPRVEPPHRFYAFYELVVPDDPTFEESEEWGHEGQGKKGSELFQVSTRFKMHEDAKSSSVIKTLDSFAAADFEDLSNEDFSKIEMEEGIVPAGKFFGVDVQGETVVFVVDASGSMLEKVGPQTRMKMANQGIKNAISGLRPHQRFNVILFADRVEIFREKAIHASLANKAKAYRFLNQEFDVGGTTNLQSALSRAIKLNPDTIIVLSDGQANSNPNFLLTQIHYLREKIDRQMCIHAIGFFLPPQGDAEQFLIRLTQQNNGIYSRWTSRNFSKTSSKSQLSQNETTGLQKISEAQADLHALGPVN